MAGFPDAVIAAKEGKAAEHADYGAAKAGDTDAAVRLVDDVLPQIAITRLRRALAGRHPVVVPVIAMEQSGANKIPLAYANAISNAVGHRHCSDLGGVENR